MVFSRSVLGTLGFVLAGWVAVVGSLLGSPVASAEGAWGSPGSSGSALPYQWELEEVSQDAVLRDAAGRVLPWSVPPVHSGGVVVVTPPLLPPGQYVVSSSAGEVSVSVPGFDYASVAVSGATGAPVLLVVASGAGALGCGVLALLWWRRRRRPVAAALAAASVGLASAGILLLVIPGDAPGELSVGSAARQVVACPQYPWEDLSRCAGPLLVGALLRSGPSSGMEVVEEAAKAAPIDCHDLAHDVGRASWLLTRDPDQIVAVDRPGSCQFGFAHGALESAAVTETDEGLLAVAAVTCQGFVDKASEGVSEEFVDLGGQCYHGLGHAVIRRSAANLDRALPLCDAAPQEEFVQQCQIGALMEWGRLWRLSQDGQVPAPPGPVDPRSPCLEFAGPFLEECYFGGASAVLEVEVPAEMVAWCDAVGEEHRVTCLHGTLRAFPTADNDVSRLLGYCGLVDKSMQRWCVKSMAKSLARSHRNDPLALCGKFAEFEQVCRVTVRDFFEDLARSGDTAVVLPPEPEGPSGV